MSVVEEVESKKIQTLSQAIIPQHIPVAETVQPNNCISQTPIIIVPCAVTSIITMYNAADILQDLR
jgi:hypothetical protein